MSAAADIPFRRLLVPLDATPDRSALLETGAGLAARLGVEFLGIYVEDINLRRLAGLPFAREVMVESATELRLDVQRAERVQRIHFTQTRERVLTVSQHLSVRGSCQAVLGHKALQELAQPSDLLLLGAPASTTAYNQTPPWEITRQIAASMPCSVLLFPAGATLACPVAVEYPGTGEASARHLLLAARMARLYNKKLVVFLGTSDTVETRPLCASARQHLGAGEILVVYQNMDSSEPAALIRACQKEGVKLFVCGAETLTSRPPLIRALLEKLRTPVLLARP